MKRGIVLYFVMLSLLLGSFSVSMANEVYIVRGLITNPGNMGLSGIRIRVINKSPAGDIPLGETTSDSRGNYQVSFALPAGTDQLNLQVQAYDHQQNLVASSNVSFSTSNRQTINMQVGRVETSNPVVETDNQVEETESPSVSPSKPTPKPPKPAPERQLTDLPALGYGMIVGHINGLSAIYWADSLGGQLIMSEAGNNTANIKARLHLKILALPFGRISLAPQVGSQLNLSGGTASIVSNSSYGLVGVAELILQDTWLSELADGKALGISAEIGLYGQGIRNIVFDPNQLTTGFSIAGHIYL